MKSFLSLVSTQHSVFSMVTVCPGVSGWCVSLSLLSLHSRNHPSLGGTFADTKTLTLARSSFLWEWEWYHYLYNAVKAVDSLWKALKWSWIWHSPLVECVCNMITDHSIKLSMLNAGQDPTIKPHKINQMAQMAACSSMMDVLMVCWVEQNRYVCGILKYHMYMCYTHSQWAFSLSIHC